MVISPEVLLLLRIVFAVLGFLLFQMNLQIALSLKKKDFLFMHMSTLLLSSDTPEEAIRPH